MVSKDCFAIQQLVVHAVHTIAWMHVWHTRIGESGDMLAFPETIYT